MFLFIARHAESEVTKDYWQTPDSKLGEYGKRQADALGKHLKFYKIDQIFSSDLERSKKTAGIISKNLGVSSEILDYTCERKQLAEIYGARRDSQTSKKYLEKYRNNFGNLDWKFENKEESIREVLNRTSRLLDFLIKNYQGRRVLIISHDIFIRCLIGRILLGSNYIDKSMARVIRLININSTGLSLLIHDSQRKTWQINYINNYSHLKGIERK